VSGLPAAIERAAILEMLGAQQGRDPELVPEKIGSLDLAWLLHTLQERYGVELPISDAELGHMCTVTGAVEVLAKALSRVGAR